MSFQDWLSKNLFDGTGTTYDDSWPLKFAILCWLIWKRRCDMLLNPNAKDVEDIVAKGNRLLEECRQAFQENVENRVEQGSNMKWISPAVGWVKLNVDASVEPNTSRVGIGGLIRDDRGCWRAGFASALVASIRKMLNKDWHVIVHHVTRNRNHVADKLSRRGREGQRKTDLMLEAPEEISSIVMEEGSVRYSMINATGIEERDLPFDPSGFNVRT
ncbi:hypothetical protein V6N13_076591 [Hibiscus sabdariffa]